MSLLLAGLLFASTSGALYVGRYLARRRGTGDADRPPDAPPEKAGEDEVDASARKEVDAEVPKPKDESHPVLTPAPAPKKKARPPVPPDRTLSGFVCQLGDVVMRHTGEEAWLAGAVVLSEDHPLAVLFVAPDAGHDTAIFVRTEPRDHLLWLEPLDPTAVLVGGEPPSSVEHGGIRFDRSRRLPLRPLRIGVGGPDFGDAVTVAEYASAGAERLVVFKATSGVVRAYRGVELEEGSFEVIASGASTLES